MPKKPTKTKTAPATPAAKSTRWIQIVDGNAMITIDLTPLVGSAYASRVTVSFIGIRQERNFMDTREIVSVNEDAARLQALRVAVEMCVNWMGRQP